MVLQGMERENSMLVAQRHTSGRTSRLFIFNISIYVTSTENSLGFKSRIRRRVARVRRSVIHNGYFIFFTFIVLLLV